MLKIIVDEKNKKVVIKRSFLWITLWEYSLENDDESFILTKWNKELFRSNKQWKKPKLLIETPLNTAIKSPGYVWEKYEVYVVYNDEKYTLSMGHILSSLIPFAWFWWFEPGAFTYSDIKKIWDVTGIEIPFSSFEQWFRWIWSWIKWFAIIVLIAAFIYTIILVVQEWDISIGSILQELFK